MPSPMAQQNWVQLLEPGLREIFYLQQVATVTPSKLPALFNMDTSQKAVEHNFGVGGFGNVPIYNGAIDYDAFDPNYKTDFEHIEFTLGAVIERKLVDDDLYHVVAQQITKLGTAFARTRERHGASVFANAFSTTDVTGLYAGSKKLPVGADGIALCGAHPLSPTNATAQSNAGTTPLSYDAVVATRKLMRKFKDDRNELLLATPDTLIVGPNLEDVAMTIMESMNKPGTTNNDVNVVRNQGYVRNVIVWDYIDADNPSGTGNSWFYADSTLMKQHLWWFQRASLEFAIDPASNFDLQTRSRGYERYSYGWDFPLWVYGHNV